MSNESELMSLDDALAFIKEIDEHREMEEKKQPVVNKPCVLAVDDAPDVLKSIYHELRNDYRVLTLPRPEMLYGLLQNAKPDLFLLDYNMPVLSGFDLIPIIRSNKMHTHTPIVFLTSEGTVCNFSVAIALGACDFIVKPFDPDILREKIAKHIKKPM